MDKVTNERLRFYLERRERIDEWCAIRAEEPPVVDAFLADLLDDVRALAGRRLAQADLDRDGSERWLRIARPSWPEEPDGHRPAIVVALGWFPRKVTFVGEEQWVGLRLSTQLDAVVRERIEASLAGNEPVREAFPLEDKVDPWVRWRLSPCDRLAEYWDDLRPYRSQLLADLEEAFDTFAPIVDDALG